MQQEHGVVRRADRARGITSLVKLFAARSQAIAGDVDGLGKMNRPSHITHPNVSLF